MSTPLVSTDPKNIANAARCFFQCVPPGYHLSLKTHLLSKVVVIASPPCNAPAVPTNVQLGAFTIQNTKLSLSWNYPKNSGSLVTSFKVGTVSGGPYTIIQSVGAGKRVVTVDKLTPGTTYFAIVIANSTAGCSSAASAEASGTTSGVAPPPGNGLLNGLLGYWKADEGNGAARADATGNGWTATVANGACNATAGIINNGLAQALFATDCLSISKLIDSRAQTAPFSFQVWFQFEADRTGNIMCGETGATEDWWMDYQAGGRFRFLSQDNTNTQTTLNGELNAGLVATNWYHIVVTWDGTTARLYTHGAGFTGTPTSVVLVGVRRGDNNIFIGSDSTFANSPSGNFDEWGYWNRALSAADITTLFNAGAGFPFGSFTT